MKATKGAFSKTKDGWMINTQIKVNGEFKHFTKRGYKTLSEAKEDYARAENEFIKKHTSKHKVMTYNDLLVEYKEMRKKVVNITTVVSDDSIYNHLNFGDLELKDCLNKEFIKEWYDLLISNQNLSNNRKYKVITRIKDVLLFAYKHKYIDGDTYQDCDIEIYQIKTTKKPQTERVVWTDEEVESFFKTLKENGKYKEYVMFELFISTGLRIGELIGLQGKCFDYEKRRIDIFQQVVKTDKGIELTKTLKTSDSNRSILLTKEMANSLQEYIETFGVGDDDFIFFAKDMKKPLSRTDIRRKLYFYCDKAKIRRANPHAAFRHYKAVQLSSVCKTMEDIEIASKIMGHSPSMFANTYANHTNVDSQSELLNRLSPSSE